jgi:hypothetical protein
MFMESSTQKDQQEFLVEGLYADEYPDCDSGSQRAQIREEYRQRWPRPDMDPTPLSHPWLFDPCDPPEGWRYDPYYELWLKL